MKKEKFYFVYPYSPCEGGYILKALSVHDARVKAYKYGLFDCDYIDIRAKLLKNGKDADYEFLEKHLENDICELPTCPKCEVTMLTTFKEAEEGMCIYCKKLQEVKDPLEREILEERIFGCWG